jgi:homoserine O-acetyltransferase/O-succinyltransferase
VDVERNRQAISKVEQMKTLLAFAAAACVAASARAEPQIFNVYDFEFENGSVLPELRVVYETHGKLNAGRDNAILLVHGTSADRHAFDPVIGPGRTFDTDKHFVITVDAIGGGDSSSPKDGLGQDFPRYTIRDMMAAQHALVTRGLELATLRAVGGSSMGSFVSLEWGIHHPEMVRSLILLVPSPKAEASFRVPVDLMTSVIALDPEWQGGRYTHNPTEGLRLAGMVYYPWVVSAPYLDRLPAKRLVKELEESARSFGNWDANSLVLRYAASRAHDVSAPFGGDMTAALSQITAPTLILPSASDRLLGLAGARRIRDGVKQASYAEIPSDLGHRAARPAPGTPEGDFIDREIRAFLVKVE